MKTRMNSLYAGIAGIGLLALPPLVAADVTAVFETGDETMTIEYRDDQNVRMRAPGDGYIMRQDDEVYIISREGDDWRVLALSDFAAMMGGIAAGAGQNAATDTAEMEDGVDFRDTGRTEVVAGIEGTVHEVVESDADGWGGGGGGEVVAEVVMTDHDAAVQAYRGLFSIIGAMGEMAGQQGLGDMMQTAYGVSDRAILRSNDDWRLVSLDESSIPDNYFTLPAEPTSIPGFGGTAGSAGSGGQGADAASAAAGWLENLTQEAGRTAEDEVESVADDAQQETERSVTEGVRDGIRDGIRGIFGR